MSVKPGDVRLVQPDERAEGPDLATVGVARKLKTGARGGEVRGLARLMGEHDQLALGIVGGTLRVHPTARLALRILGVTRADELALVAASAGLASNLAALRALATEGIQRGHMSLHARSVAIAAGAIGTEVEFVASRIADEGNVTLDAAVAVLSGLRGGA